MIVCVQVATNTGAGGRIIIAIVAINAIVGNGNMGASQCVIIIMDWEGGWFPSRKRCVTGCTSGRNIDCSVIRICRGVIIR